MSASANTSSAAASTSSSSSATITDVSASPATAASPVVPVATLRYPSCQRTQEALDAAVAAAKAANLESTELVEKVDKHYFCVTCRLSGAKGIIGLHDPGLLCWRCSSCLWTPFILLFLFLHLFGLPSFFVSLALADRTSAAKDEKEKASTGASSSSSSSGTLCFSRLHVLFLHITAFCSCASALFVFCLSL